MKGMNANPWRMVRNDYSRRGDKLKVCIFYRCIIPHMKSLFLELLPFPCNKLLNSFSWYDELFTTGDIFTPEKLFLSFDSVCFYQFLDQPLRKTFALVSFGQEFLVEILKIFRDVRLGRELPGFRHFSG